MAKKFLVNLDLNGNLLLNPVLNPLASAPANAKPYYVYTSTASADLGTIYENVGTYASPVWKAIGAVQSVNGKTGVVVLDKTDIGLGNVDNTSDATKKSNFTGSIADADTGFVTGDAVFDALALKLSLAGGTMSGNIAMGGNKVTGLADGTSDQDAVTVAQMGEAIATSTGFFRGSFATKAALDAVQWQTTDPSAANYVTNNDYAVVEDDETQNDECWRYVYVTGTGWTAQYRINESPLTPAQIAAINSGITSALVAQIGTNQTDVGAVKSMIADSEASATAATAHAIGDYFIYNNKLYRATAAISVGGTITPNTNCVEVSLEEELKLKAAIASPAFTGTPTAPTATAGTNTTQIATTAFVDAAVKGTVTATTGTIGTSATTVTVNYTGTFVNAYAHQSGAIVVTDVTVNSSNVVFTVAAAPSAAITCVVVAAKAEELISFTVANTTYQAESGMTWGGWVNSAYNTDNYGVEAGTNTIVDRGAAHYVSTTSTADPATKVKSTDTIIGAATYYLLGNK